MRYLGGWKWAFEVPGPPIDKQRSPADDLKATVRSWLGLLLSRMGRSLNYDTSGTPPDNP